MVVLDTLRDVDDVELFLVVENVVLGEIGVDQLADVEHLAHDLDQLDVEEPRPVSRDLGVLQAGRRPPVPPDKAHDQDVHLECNRLGRADPGVSQPDQVPHLLLRPDLDHLPRVGLCVPRAEPVLARHVLVAVLKHQNGGLEHLDGIVLVVLGLGVVHVRLLSGRDAPVDLGKQAFVEHLEDDHPRPRVEHLLGRRPIRLVLPLHLGLGLPLHRLDLSPQINPLCILLHRPRPRRHPHHRLFPRRRSHRKVLCIRKPIVVGQQPLKLGIVVHIVLVILPLCDNRSTRRWLWW